MQQKGKRVHPEIPYRPQGYGKSGKKQHQTAQNPKQYVQAQLPFRPAQSE